MVSVMMHQISQTARTRAKTTTSVLDSTGIQAQHRINAAGCMDLGLVDGTTALLQASLTTSWTEAAWVSTVCMLAGVPLSQCNCTGRVPITAVCDSYTRKPSSLPFLKNCRRRKQASLRRKMDLNCSFLSCQTQ